MKAKEKPLYHYRAMANNVVDGDTVDLVVDLGFSIAFELRVRLLGINTPELHSKVPSEREAALKAKERVSELVMKLRPELLIETVKDDQDKYGRYLARITLPDGHCVNDMLLAEGLAVPMGD